MKKMLNGKTSFDFKALHFLALLAEVTPTAPVRIPLTHACS